MAKNLAFSSVSVVDLTDVGQINFYLTSNLPTSVIYDPNQNNGTYTPDWSTTNLVITPVISYNGSSLALNATGLIITFQRKEGTGTASSLITGEAVSNGILTVSANKLANVSSGLLTYICTIQYTDPDTGVPITTVASLTYTLVTMASELKYASITGESVFLYDTNKSIVGSDSITLTAELTNVSVVQWQYKKANGDFDPFPTTYNQSISGDTLIVKATEQNIWLNGKTAIIKLVTSANDVYDITQISKIEDGAAGNALLSVVLGNESHVVPANSDGTVRTWDGAATQIYIYEGADDVTNYWTVSVVNGSGLSGTYNSTTHIYTPSGLTQDSSYADFTCTRTGYADLHKRYKISKQYPGLDGKDAVVYDITPSVYVMTLNESGVFSPTTVTFSAYKKIGDALSRTAYQGRLIISESTDGSTYTAKYTSSSNETSKVYTPTSDAVVGIKCSLYASGGTTTLLDEQTVLTVKDGASGQDGDDGTDGLSVGLGNYGDVIPCDTSGNASATRDFTIPFYAYKGITRVAVTATPGTLPTGVTVKSNTAGTTQANGSLVLTVAQGATFGNSSLMSGDITITLSAESKTVEQKYSWTKSKQAANGTSAVLLQLYSEDGGVVKEGQSTTIRVMMYSGTTAVTPTSVTWAAFENGSYETISGQTGTSITISPDDVQDQMWLRCQAVYSGNTYTAYYTIDDVTDNMVCYVFATVSQFKNSQGCGAVYCRTFRDGTEIDLLPTTTFSETPPTAPSTGDYYYKLDRTLKTCTLMKYSGSAWAADNTYTPTYQYSYYRLNNNGESLDTSTAWKTDRCFYIDPSMINGRMTFICEVSDS